MRKYVELNAQMFGIFRLYIQDVWAATIYVQKLLLILPKLKSYLYSNLYSIRCTSDIDLLKCIVAAVI